MRSHTGCRFLWRWRGPNLSEGQRLLQSCPTPGHLDDCLLLTGYHLKTEIKSNESSFEIWVPSAKSEPLLFTYKNYIVKPVLSNHSKIDKSLTNVLKTDGSLM